MHTGASPSVLVSPDADTIHPYPLQLKGVVVVVTATIMQDPASPSGGGSGGGSFTDDQLDMLVTLERVGGSISLVSVLLVFLAFALVRRVRNVQNTFIVFASVSNVGASVASIVALDGLAAGKRSPLCQAQGFMFQM